MVVLETLAVAFGMFSAVPVPQPEWNEKNMRYSMCAFPFVGAVSGLCLLGWGWLCGVLQVQGLGRAAGFCLLPVLVTGGIHLDGYADTCDARCSYGDREKKQKILADPHCGAFAVIRLCTYFTATLGLWSVLEPTMPVLVCAALGQMVSRSLSGAALTVLPLARDSGLAHAFASTAHKGRVRQVLTVYLAALAAGLWLAGGPARAGAMAAAAAVCLWRYKKVSQQEFGGISGDLAGWFLQKTEFWMLAALTACQLVGNVL